MLGTILVAALLLGYGGWVIVRKVRQGRQRWKEGCGGCCSACNGGCKGKMIS